jgi:hypothetical protein
VQLWFITPAFQRFALSEVCFDQWKQVATALAERGVELRVVVVADDENLDLARAAGFDTVEQNNDWLGRRFNDGIEYACRNGADWVAPIGSDSFISADYLYPLPGLRTSRRARLLTVVRQDRLAELYVDLIGVGPFMYHRSLLRPCGFRPAEDRINRGCDTSTMLGIAEHRTIRWQERNVSQYQHISFRGTPHLTKYSRLWVAYGVRELYDPWGVLPEHYPADLVERARLAIGGHAYRAVA